MAGMASGGYLPMPAWATNPANTTVASYTGQVATGCRPPVTLTNNRRVLSRVPVWSRSAITNIRLILPNFYLIAGSGEVAPGGTCDFAASVEYPANTLVQIQWSASATTTVADGGITALSDSAVISIPANTLFWINIYARNAVTPCIVVSPNAATRGCDTANGGLNRVSTTDSGVTDQTMTASGSWSGGSVNTNYSLCPLIIAGTTTRRSALVIGDSLCNYRDDSYDGVSSDIGYGGRLVGQSLAYTKYCVDGLSIGNIGSLLSFTHPALTTITAYFSDVFNFLGGNDAVYGDDVATILANLVTLRALFPSQTWTDTTFTHRTVTSTDGYITIANQSRSTGVLAVIVGVNAAIRAGRSGVSRVIEIDDLVSTARDSGYWPIGGTANQYTTDGTHITQFEAKYVRDNALVRPL